MTSYFAYHFFYQISIHVFQPFQVVTRRYGGWYGIHCRMPAQPASQYYTNLLTQANLSRGPLLKRSLVDSRLDHHLQNTYANYGNKNYFYLLYK